MTPDIIKSTIEQIMIAEGPDMHTNGSDLITSFVEALLIGKGQEWRYKYLTGKELEKSYSIKHECNHLYGQIKQAEDRLKELREVCKHESTFEGDYMYRPGSIHKADICEFCGTPVRYHDI